jgi:ABC-type transport system involved in multi-copper enzyme maturation permease subunit
MGVISTCIAWIIGLLIVLTGLITAMVFLFKSSTDEGVKYGAGLFLTIFSLIAICGIIVSSIFLSIGIKERKENKVI